MSDLPIRVMSQAEQQMYELGAESAREGLPPLKADEPMSREMRLAFERGYTNYAGEAVDA